MSHLEACDQLFFHTIIICNQHTFMLKSSHLRFSLTCIASFLYSFPVHMKFECNWYNLHVSLSKNNYLTIKFDAFNFLFLNKLLFIHLYSKIRFQSTFVDWSAFCYFFDLKWLTLLTLYCTRLWCKSKSINRLIFKLQNPFFTNFLILTMTVGWPTIQMIVHSATGVCCDVRFV